MWSVKKLRETKKGNDVTIVYTYIYVHAKLARLEKEAPAINVVKRGLFSSGGMFALGAKTQENEVSNQHMDIAAGLTNTCHESYDRSSTKLGPEAFHFIEGNEAKSLKNGEKYYILRPEVSPSLKIFLLLLLPSLHSYSLYTTLVRYMTMPIMCVYRLYWIFFLPDVIFFLLKNKNKMYYSRNIEMHK